MTFIACATEAATALMHPSASEARAERLPRLNHLPPRGANLIDHEPTLALLEAQASQWPRGRHASARNARRSPAELVLVGGAGFGEADGVVGGEEPLGRSHDKHPGSVDGCRDALHASL